MMNRNTIAVAGALAVLASVACATAHAQSVPDVGERGAMSTVQATACVPPSPVNDRYNHCGWGVWRLETQRSAVIATLAEPASYLICREMVDAAEPGGYPISVEADGVAISTGAPAAAAGHAPGGCFLVSGKKIVINGAARPQKPVNGYYIRWVRCLGRTRCRGRRGNWPRPLRIARCWRSSRSNACCACASAATTCSATRRRTSATTVSGPTADTSSCAVPRPPCSTSAVAPMCPRRCWRWSRSGLPASMPARGDWCSEAASDACTARPASRQVQGLSRALRMLAGADADP
jgi:hypothetical protein